MEQICISFNDRKYTGALFCSREKKPFFYWCYFEDNDLLDAIGECIGFVEKNGELRTTEYFPQQYQPVIDAIKSYIQQRYYTPGPPSKCSWQQKEY